MGRNNQLYRASFGLLTDLYQLTMAYGYWKLGRAQQEVVFHLFFRRPPFQGGYAVAAGMSQVADYLAGLRFEADDLDYLRTLKGNDGQAMFEPAFLDELGAMRFTCDIDAVPEGTVVFGQAPLLRVRGPILQAQLIESAMLNMVNFQTLIATKASRVCAAAGDDPVLEFGLRRAQGIDGALSASRAAYLGGCAATSNVLAGKLYGIPVRGTHAHSWVMSFDDELEAFEGYAQALPNNCVFLVDTYDTLQGVRNAISVGLKLRERGQKMVGIRLDSGDLAYLSIEARKLLDAAGFEGAVIVASNDLDEHIIRDLKEQGAQIAVWGVGTKLATSYDQPALGGVYKLGAIRNTHGSWEHRVKLSEQAIKTTIPGMLQVRRFEKDGQMVADMIYDELSGPGDSRVIVDPNDPTRHREVAEDATHRDLLLPMVRGGEVVMADEPLDEKRARAKQELNKLHPGVRRFMNAHAYPVGIDSGLHALRSRMIDAMRGG